MQQNVRFSLGDYDTDDGEELSIKPESVQKYIINTSDLTGNAIVLPEWLLNSESLKCLIHHG